MGTSEVGVWSQSGEAEGLALRIPWTLETLELQFLERGDCQQVCQDESGSVQRQEGP